MGLEVPTNKTPGDILRTTAAERPAFVGMLILLLTAVEFVFVFLIFAAIINGANLATDVHPDIKAAFGGGVLKSEQQIIALWLGCAFYCLAFITFLYQRYFMDHITMAKRRFRKWEDEGVQLHG